MDKNILIGGAILFGFLLMNKAKAEKEYLTGKISHSIGDINPEQPPYQYTPIETGLTTAGNYNDSTKANIFHSSSYVRNSGSSPTVAIFGEGIADGDNSKTWGGNHVAYANSPTGIAIGNEINFGVLKPGGIAYGNVIVSAGDYPTENYIQVQSNRNQSTPKNGIVFNSWERPPINENGTLIKTEGQSFTIENGIDLSNLNIKGFSILLPKNNAAISFDDNDYMFYDDNNNSFNFVINNKIVGYINSTGIHSI